MRSFTYDDDVSDQNHAPSESDIHFLCQNCRVRTTNGGICRRCVDLPSCVRCKWYLPSNCFDNVDNRVCQDPDESKLKFCSHDKEFPLKFYLVWDFESFLHPTDDNPQSKTKTRVIDEHHVSGYCCYRVTDLPQYQTPPTVYSGENVMEHFYNHIMSESEAISRILSQQLPLHPCPTTTSDYTSRPSYAPTVTIPSLTKTTRSDTTTIQPANFFLRPVIIAIYNSSRKM